MGEIADGIINGDFCQETGEYIGKGQGFPRTAKKAKSKRHKLNQAEKNIKKVRKELAILINTKKKEYPDINENKIVDKCRQFINLKYGRFWRERGLVSNDFDQWNEMSSYQEPIDFKWI